VTKAKFKFLGLGGKPDAKLRKMWDLAQIILKTVVKLKTGVAEVIIKQLSKRIMYSKAAPRYTDTGYSLSDQHIVLNFRTICVKFRFSEKAKNIQPIFHFLFDITY
jgi:hypothetical protein